MTFYISPTLLFEFFANLDCENVDVNFSIPCLFRDGNSIIYNQFLSLGNLRLVHRCHQIIYNDLLYRGLKKGHT